ncbi:hypothetical protein BY996DRAFT_7030227 [Phakopsora pachyrhizi]|nr:hypothetical protein BY996DRAFT_7030227 [Phakopsora pachyrhizi]
MTILKLGDSDWLIKTLMDHYPKFLNHLASILYPVHHSTLQSHIQQQQQQQPSNDKHQSTNNKSSSSNETTTIRIDETVYSLRDVPSGKVLKYLIKCYTATSDFERALRIIRLYQTLVLKLSKDYNDFSPQLTFLRDLSRLKIYNQSSCYDGLSRKRRREMVVEVLKFLITTTTTTTTTRNSDEKGQRFDDDNNNRVGIFDKLELDSFKFDGLIDLRYRLRSEWNESIRRKNFTCFKMIEISWTDQIRNFLIHHHHSSSNFKRYRVDDEVGVGVERGVVNNKSGLIRSQSNPSLSMSWRFRPSSRTFKLLLLSLISELKYQTRNFRRSEAQGRKERGRIREISDEVDDYYYYYSSEDLSYESDSLMVESDDGVSRSFRRPSPGPHRRLVSQLFAFQSLNCSIQNTLRF